MMGEDVLIAKVESNDLRVIDVTFAIGTNILRMVMSLAKGKVALAEITKFWPTTEQLGDDVSDVHEIFPVEN